MTQNKKIIGITGGSGCGKSYISSGIRARGIPVIDADKTAHQVMNEDMDCVHELSDFFGEDIYENGVLNRKKLGGIVFAEPEKLKKLNEISHKYILRNIDNKIKSEVSKLVFVDGATLLESGMRLDGIIGVIADYVLRKKRIMARDDLTEDSADARLSAQPEDGFYIEHCDFVVYNNGTEPDIDGIIKKATEI